MEVNKKSLEVHQRKKEIEKKKDLYQKYKTTVENIKNIIKKENIELDEIKNILLVHYHKLLAEGRDTRKEGLCWLIKAIWNLGSKVIASYLPSFLDEKSISFIYNYTTKDIEYAKLKKKLDEIHLKMRIKREKINIPDKHSLPQMNQTGNTFKTDLNMQMKSIELDSANEFDSEEILSSNVLKGLIAKYKQENNVWEDNLNMKKIEQIMKKKGQLGEDAMEYIKCVTELESQLKNIQNLMMTMKKTELARVNKEFYTNDYERRYKVSQENMISALIGEDNTPNELSRQKRDQKKYFQQLENIRNYNILGASMKKKRSASMNFEPGVNLD
jgi:hypothetical protein